MDLRLQVEPPSSASPAHLLRSDPDGSSALVFERDGQRAWLHAPMTPATAPLPLLIVLHGAGKDRMWNLKESVDAWAARAEAHGMLVLYPEARDHTWDYIKSKRTARSDFDFLQDALGQALRTFRVDPRRIALLGISDGGSMALTLATHNPQLFQAAMSVSAGFCAARPGPPQRAAAALAPRIPRLDVLAQQDRPAAARQAAQARVQAGAPRGPRGRPCAKGLAGSLPADVAGDAVRVFVESLRNVVLRGSKTYNGCY